MSTNESSPNIETNETNVQNNLSTQSGYPNMSNEKTFIVQNGLLVEGDAVVTGTVTATSFIGDGSQLTGISGGGGGGGLDSAAVTLLVDSDYVTARAPAGGGLEGFDVSQYDSATSNGIFEYNVSGGGQKQLLFSLNTAVDPIPRSDATLDNQVNYTLSTNHQFGFKDAGGFRTEVYGRAAGTTASTGLVLTGPTYNNSGVELVGNVKLSSLPTSDPSESGLLWNDGGIPVFSGSTAPTGGGGGGLDSAEVQGVVDDNLLGGVSNTGVVIGPSATADATKLQMTVIGPSATTNGAYNVAIGRSASVQSGEENAVAIGNQARAGFSTGGLGGVSIGNSSTVQYDYGVAVGMLAEVKNAHGVALGYQAEVTGSRGIAIGSNAFAQGSFSTALGQNAQSYGQNSLTIGYGAGNTTGGDGTVLIGTNAGQSVHLRSTAVAVGMNAQLENDANVSASVAVGYEAGKTRQESSTVAIGYKAGETDQLNSATALGFQAGNTSQGGSSVAIGRDAAFTGQAINSVAIGRAAGYENQGTRSIAIGRQAGATNQGANNIILNATSGALNRTDQFGIDIRTSAAGSLTYDTTNDWTFGAGVTMTDLTASGATVVFNNLPTTDPVNAGQLWNDAGTLKVSAG